MKKNVLCMLACLGIAGYMCESAEAMKGWQNVKQFNKAAKANKVVPVQQMKKTPLKLAQDSSSDEYAVSDNDIEVVVPVAKKSRPMTLWGKFEEIQKGEGELGKLASQKIGGKEIRGIIGEIFESVNYDPDEAIKIEKEGQAFIENVKNTLKVNDIEKLQPLANLLNSANRLSVVKVENQEAENQPAVDENLFHEEEDGADQVIKEEEEDKLELHAGGEKGEENQNVKEEEEKAEALENQQNIAQESEDENEKQEKVDTPLTEETLSASGLLDTLIFKDEDNKYGFAGRGGEFVDNDEVADLALYKLSKGTLAEQVELSQLHSKLNKKDVLQNVIDIFCDYVYRKSIGDDKSDVKFFQKFGELFGKTEEEGYWDNLVKTDGFENVEDVKNSEVYAKFGPDGSVRKKITDDFGPTLEYLYDNAMPTDVANGGNALAVAKEWAEWNNGLAQIMQSLEKIEGLDELNAENAIDFDLLRDRLSYLATDIIFSPELKLGTSDFTPLLKSLNIIADMAGLMPLSVAECKDINQLKTFLYCIAVQNVILPEEVLRAQGSKFLNNAIDAYKSAKNKEKAGHIFAKAIADFAKASALLKQERAKFNDLSASLGKLGVEINGYEVEELPAPTYKDGLKAVKSELAQKTKRREKQALQSEILKDLGISGAELKHSQAVNLLKAELKSSKKKGAATESLLKELGIPAPKGSASLTSINEVDILNRAAEILLSNKNSAEIGNAILTVTAQFSSDSESSGEEE